MFKVNNKDTWTKGMTRSLVFFIANFEIISHYFLQFLLLILNK